MVALRRFRASRLVAASLALLAPLMLGCGSSGHPQAGVSQIDAAEVDGPRPSTDAAPEDLAGPDRSEAVSPDANSVEGGTADLAPPTSECPSGCGDGGCGPVVLADGLASPRGIALGEDAVYFTNFNADTVMKVAKMGGPPVVIVPKRFPSDQPWGIALDATHVYWTSYFRSYIARAGLNGENVELVVPSGEGYAEQIVVDDTSAYWIRHGIRKTALAGGAPVTSVSAGATDLVVHAGSIYWTVSRLSDGTGKVMKMGVDGQAPTELASDAGVVVGLALGGGNVYWASGRGSIMSVPMAGGVARTVTDGLKSPSYVAVDNGWVYWTDGREGIVMKAALPAGPPIPLATGMAPTRILTDACNVYWLDQAAGRVMKLAK